MSSVVEEIGTSRKIFGGVSIPHGMVVICVVLAYCLPGLIGHEPWKPDEGYIFAGIYHMLQTGDWIVPHLAGEPFMEKPPLYHWFGAATATLTHSFLSLHDGARLASGLFIGITIAATAFASRIAWGAGAGRIAVLILLGTLGLLNTILLMLPDLPLMAGFALAMLGFVAYAFDRKWAFLAVGTGAGMGFLAKGLLAPGALGLAAIALPVCFAQWRNRRYARMLVLAFLVALPWLIIWPAMLYARSPQNFVTWFWDNNVGRFLGFSTDTLGAATTRAFWTEAFPWFLFPWWLFIATGLWTSRRKILGDAGVQVGLTIAISLAFVLAIAGSARVIYALPILPAFALATTGARLHVPTWLWTLLAGLGIVVASIAAPLSWFLWGSLISTGHVPAWRWLERSLPLEFTLSISTLSVTAALLVTAGWLGIVLYRRRLAQGPLLIWSASLALSWALPALLLMPWLDAAKGYRGVFEDLGRTLPATYSCVQSEFLGESERGILQYTVGVVTVRSEVSPTANCPFLVRQVRQKDHVPAPESKWTLLWTGGRPSCGYERFELYASRSLTEGRLHAAELTKRSMAMEKFLDKAPMPDRVKKLSSYPQSISSRVVSIK